MIPRSTLSVSLPPARMLQKTGNGLLDEPEMQLINAVAWLRHDSLVDT